MVSLQSKSDLCVHRRDTLDIIEYHIERLSEVPGIAKKRVKLIQRAWDSQKAIKEVMVFLQGHGVSTIYAVKIFKQYGDEAIETVTHNPYRLATDVYGIGFVSADQIARSLGISPHSEYRYRSGLLHVLSESAEEGHCYLPQPDLIDRAVKRLTLPEYQPKPDQVEYLIHAMISDAELIIEKLERVTATALLCYAPPFFQAEFHLSRRLLQLLTNPVVVDRDRVRVWLERFMAHMDINLSAQQQQAVELAASQRAIKTGGNVDIAVNWGNE